MDSVKKAKDRLDSIINKSRVDLYKPIQIAEVLRRSRLQGDINVKDRDTFQNPSTHWRNEVTKRLLHKISTSSANYQHDIWNAKAMPPEILSILDVENKRTNGDVECYIYLRFNERQETVAKIIKKLENTSPKDFQLKLLLHNFVTEKGIKRSIDKAYEIVAYCLFETVIVTMETRIKVSIPSENWGIFDEFSDLTSAILGLKSSNDTLEIPAHIYRVGVTNSADRGLDMWANFGPAIQVKHLTLDDNLAQSIVDQIESDHIVIVCRDVDAEVIKTVTKQISWGRRVRGIVTESQLVDWYERCMRGQFAKKLGEPLLESLVDGFKAEFPQAEAIIDFLQERQYITDSIDELWKIESL